MEKVLGLIGLITIVFITYKLSKEKENINWKMIIRLLLLQVGLAFLLVKTPLWKIVELLSNGFNNLLLSANEGITFVFGDMVTGGFSLFLSSLMPIVFISALVGLLFHFNIIQRIIKIFSVLLAKKLNVDTIVVVNSLSNALLGQSESLFITKMYLPKSSDKVIFATLVGGMTSISASIISLYLGFGASLEYILISIILTVIGTFTFTQIIFPTTYESIDNLEITTEKGNSAIETMLNFANEGLKGVFSISVALIVFVSLVALINMILSVFGITLQDIFKIVFAPLAFLMGINLNEVGLVSELLSTKLVLNEAVAFSSQAFTLLSERTRHMMTVALCGFAGVGSIGILLSTYSVIAKEKVQTVIKYGVLALIVATLVNISSAIILGLFI